MMYRITYNGIEIYGPSLDMAVLNPVLETELNAAGTLTFTLPITRNDGHDAIWESIQVFRGEVQVWEGDDCIWFGRPLQIVRDWNNQKKVVCEGALAYFNDSIQLTKEYKRKQTPLYADPDVYGNKKGFLNELVRLHNEAVRTSNNYEQYGDRQIYIDEDSVIDVDNELVWRQTDYQTTAECIQSMCLDTNGGYILLRKVEIPGTTPTQYKTVLDWRKEAPYGTSQPITFGENLLDINQDLNGSDLCTVLYASGPDDYVKDVSKAKNYKEDDPDHPPYEVPPAEGGKGHVLHSKPDEYIVHLEGYKKYGRIVKQKDFDLNEHDEYTDEQKANQLFKKAAKWLDDQNKNETTIEISSADLHYLPNHENYGKLRIGQIVSVHSGVHDVDDDFPIYKVSLNLDSGVKKVTIGTPPKKELTDIIKTSTSSSTRGSSGSSGSGSSDSGGGSGGGGGSTVDIPVKDVRVKNPGDSGYTSVVSNKKANIDLTGLMTDIYANGQSIKALDGAARILPGNNIDFELLEDFTGLRIHSEGGLGPLSYVRFFDKLDTAETPGVYTVDIPGSYLVENGETLTLYKDPEIGTEITYDSTQRASVTCIQNTGLGKIEYENEIHSRTLQDEFEVYFEPYIGESRITVIRCYLEDYQSITTANTGLICLLDLEIYNPDTESYEYTNDKEIHSYFWRDPSDTQEKEWYAILIDKSSNSTINNKRRIHFRASKTAQMNNCYIVYNIYSFNYPLPLLNSYMTYDSLPVKDIVSSSGDSLVDEDGIAKIEDFSKAKVEFITEINEFGTSGTDTEYTLNDPGDYIVAALTYNYNLTTDNFSMYKHSYNSDDYVVVKEEVEPAAIQCDYNNKGYGVAALYKGLPPGCIFSFHNISPGQNDKLYIIIVRVWNADVIPNFNTFWVYQIHNDLQHPFVVSTPKIDPNFGDIVIGMNVVGGNNQKYPFEFYREALYDDGSYIYDNATLTEYDKYEVKRHYDPLWEGDRGAHILADLGVIDKNIIINDNGQYPSLARKFGSTFYNGNTENEIFIVSLSFPVPISNYNAYGLVTEEEFTEEITQLQTNFQAGVDDIYDACVAKGSTPASHSLSDVVDGIMAIPSGGGGSEQINPFPSGASTISLYNSNGVSVTYSSIDSDGTGSLNLTESSAGYEGMVIELNVTENKIYKVEFDYQNIDAQYFIGQYMIGWLLENTPRTDYTQYTQWTNDIDRDNLVHHHTKVLLATGNKIYMNFNMCGYSDGYSNKIQITNLKVYCVDGSGGGGGAYTDFNYEEIIPNMTSATAPSGQVTASSQFQINYAGWRAFNDTATTYNMQYGWLAAASDSAPYIQYTMDDTKKYDRLIVRTGNNSTTTTRTVTVEGLRSDGVWENCLKSGNTTDLTFVQGTYGDTCSEFIIKLNGNSYKGIKITGNDKFYGGSNQYACTFDRIQVVTVSGNIPGLGYYDIGNPDPNFGVNGNVFTNVYDGKSYIKKNGVWQSVK